MAWNSMGWMSWDGKVIEGERDGKRMGWEKDWNGMEKYGKVWIKDGKEMGTVWERNRNVQNGIEWDMTT